MKCALCGGSVEPGSSFCGNCGAPVDNAATQNAAAEQPIPAQGADMPPPPADPTFTPPPPTGQEFTPPPADPQAQGYAPPPGPPPAGQPGAYPPPPPQGAYGQPQQPYAPNAPTRPCPFCGAPNAFQNTQCFHCGNPVGEQKSRMAAGLLAIFVGSLGIHNFYLGFTSRAVIQLVVSLVGGMFTLGIATLGIWVWALIEGIMILTNNPNHQVDAKGIPMKE